MVIQLKGKPVDINIIQAYAPTDASDEAIEQFYKELHIAFLTRKSQDLCIVIGDFNAKVGNIKEPSITGNFGLGKQNKRGDTFVKWCKCNNLCITNTLFEQHERTLYIWKSPGDNSRNQIDFICQQKVQKLS